jgi:threonine/homoserine efflux transporter RhtA
VELFRDRLTWLGSLIAVLPASPMTDQQSNQNNVSWQLLLIGIVFGLLAWILDFSLDAIFDKPSGFLQELRTPFP